MAATSSRWQRPSTYVIIFVVVVGLLAIAYYVVLPTMFTMDCGNEIRTVATDPGGALTARLFVRNCGATTGIASIVNIQRAEEKFDPDRTENVLVINGRCAVDVRWEGQGLTLRYPKACEVFHAAAPWHQCQEQLEGGPGRGDDRQAGRRRQV